MDIGVPELIMILVVVLLIFGPGRIARWPANSNPVFVISDKAFSHLPSLRQMRKSRQMFK